MPEFEYHHIVTFEETSVVGSVYYANHIRWQGRCRELFLRQYVPEILGLMEQGLALYELILEGMDEGDEIARTRIAAGILANQLGDLERARTHLVQAQWHPVYGAEAEAILADLDR